MAQAPAGRGQREDDEPGGVRGAAAAGGARARFVRASPGAMAIVAHLRRVLLRVGWHFVESTVRYGSTVIADPEASEGAEQALNQRRRTRHEVAEGLRSIERYLVKAALDRGGRQ